MDFVHLHKLRLFPSSHIFSRQLLLVVSLQVIHSLESLQEWHPTLYDKDVFLQRLSYTSQFIVLFRDLFLVPSEGMSGQSNAHQQASGRQSTISVGGEVVYIASLNAHSPSSVPKLDDHVMSLRKHPFLSLPLSFFIGPRFDCSHQLYTADKISVKGETFSSTSRRLPHLLLSQGFLEIIQPSVVINIFSQLLHYVVTIECEFVR